MRLDLPDRAPDWQDCHSGPVSPPRHPARAVFRRALAQAPRWMGPAMALRNMALRPFGLHTKTPDPLTSPGGFLDAMPVVDDSDTRFETGLSDRHLTFTLTAQSDGQDIHLTTRIWFNHWLGRVYLLVVWPAHVILIRTMLRRISPKVTP
ncbi:DUF2867 domain-containing protein [Alisedimentitalea sp. MJ-SS2]|uniref:DUF2867 domain-containing protein n=1 Tax=Aliisedimentitalea sp. MJ-SS2 TaxID=3049795 RepID=UPI00290D17C2|nr:DUF2867 domain-containing protein [Alisedimentitalea sp. MJ-SS2]MDU8929242.1 DUF2867 domain-containing protein [Alisedimentitalea sp. MJ-SS2]